MFAATLQSPYEAAYTEVPDPRLESPGDAIVEVRACCICGSDLWPYRGVHSAAPGQRLGHEFVGTVLAVGAEVSTLAPGDFVIAPFSWSDGTCPTCTDGLPIGCDNRGFWGQEGSDGGQGQYVRVPFADGTLVALAEEPDPAQVPALLALSDVMSTGQYAAVCAAVQPGSTVVVVGDGAVGLCGVLAARRMGAERIIALSRHEQRSQIARRFGATDILAQRGREAVEAVKELTAGRGAPHVLECVGTQESLETAVGAVRKGGHVGFVGVPHLDGPGVVPLLFGRNAFLGGGGAPARRFIPELLPDVLAGALDPSPVFDVRLPLSEVSHGYQMMDQRTAVKVLLTP